MTAATMSSPECSASDRMPNDPVVMPTTIFSPVIAIAAHTEFCATARFSARICSASNVFTWGTVSIIAVPFHHAKNNPHPCSTLCYDFHASVDQQNTQFRLGDSMRKQLLFVFFVSALVYAQTAPQPTSAPATPSGDVSPNAPVITLHGLCPDKPAGTDTKAPDCQTIITRADFDHIVQTLGPNMPPSARQTLAGDYARMLILSSEARKRGLQNTEHYHDMLKFLQNQLLTQELMRNLQEQAKPSPADVEKFYQDNTGRYEQISVKRLFIPRNHPQESGDAKAATASPKPLTDAELNQQGEKLRAQLVAGGDFEKLQKEVYETAGFKTPAPPTTIPNWPHDAVPASQQQLFELKPKEFSKVLVEPAGAYIFQVEEVMRTSFDQVKPQIESTLTNERLRAMMDGIITSVKPEMNPAYFGTMGAEAGNHPPAPLPSRTARPAHAAPTPQASPAPK
jgi:hypothetical protein